MTSHGDSKRRHDAQLSGSEPSKQHSTNSIPHGAVADPDQKSDEDNHNYTYLPRLNRMTSSSTLRLKPTKVRAVPQGTIEEHIPTVWLDAEYEWQEYHRAQGVDLLPNSRIPPEDYDGYIRWHLTKQENKRRINETLERRGINRADQPDVPIKTEEKQQTEESEAPIGTAQRREDSPYPDSSLLHDEWYRMLHGALTDED